jgi:lipoyl synthase
LNTLIYAKKYAKGKGQKLFTKSSIMLGLGEQVDELNQAFDDLRSFDVDVLTLGQYLRPSMEHLPVEKYLSPGEFEDLKKQAEAKGFLYVAAGPMVRSSYRAGEFFIKGVIEKERNAIHGIQAT